MDDYKYLNVDKIFSAQYFIGLQALRYFYPSLAEQGWEPVEDRLGTSIRIIPLRRKKQQPEKFDYDYPIYPEDIE